MRRWIVISAVLLLASATQTIPQLAPADSSFRVNSFVIGRQSEADVAVASSGEFVVVWSSDGQDGDSSGVFGRRFDSLGNPIGDDFQVNTFTAGIQSSPRVAVDGSGSFLVVWISFGQDGSGSGVYGQRFGPSGARLGQEFRISDTTVGAQIHPRVAAGDSGDFVMAWVDLQFSPTARGEVLVRRYDAGSQSLTPEILVSTELATQDLDPAVGMDGAGRFVVIWSRPSAGFEYESVIRGRRFDVTGQPDGSELAVSIPDPDFYFGDYATQVAMNHDGEFVAVWERRGDGVPWQLFARPYDARGVPKTSQLPITPPGGGPGGTEAEPEVAVANDGSFVVTWNGLGLRAQRFLASGSPDGADILVDPEASCCDKNPVVGMHLSGNLVMAWFRWTTAVEDIHARRFLSSCAVPGVAGFDLELASGGTDIHMTWSDVVNATDYIIFEDGSPGGPFNTETGTSPSGGAGLTVPMTAGHRFYLVAGRNGQCGLGPLM